MASDRDAIEAAVDKLLDWVPDSRRGKAEHHFHAALLSARQAGRDEAAQDTRRLTFALQHLIPHGYGGSMRTDERWITLHVETRDGKVREVRGETGRDAIDKAIAALSSPASATTKETT